MFGALGRLLRSIGYLFTGKMDKAGEGLRSNPDVIKANYDRIVREKRGRINTYKDAIAGMIAQEESKKQRLTALVDEIQKLEQLKAGAAAKARKVAQAHGGNVEAVKSDPEYLKCSAAFKDFSSTLQEKQDRAAEIEADLEQLVTNVAGHKTQIQSLMRELDKLKEEKHDAVADVMSAQEEKQLADMMTGLAEDRTGEELRELRELRNKAKANARISREVAGLDTKKAEDDFMEYARADAAADEFDALIGLSAEADGTPQVNEPAVKTSIPES